MVPDWNTKLASSLGNGQEAGKPTGEDCRSKGIPAALPVWAAPKAGAAPNPNVAASSPVAPKAPADRTMDNGFIWPLRTGVGATLCRRHDDPRLSSGALQGWNHRRLVV